jgi:hypothetical protein
MRGEQYPTLSRLDYKLSGFNIAKGSWEARVVDEVSPQTTGSSTQRGHRGHGTKVALCHCKEFGADLPMS